MKLLNFSEFLRESKTEDAEFEDWIDNSDYDKDPILRKYAGLSGKELPKHTGDAFSLDKSNKPYSAGGLLELGLYPASDGDISSDLTTKHTPVELVWTQAFGLIVVLAGDQYVAWDTKKMDKSKVDLNDKSDDVFKIWKKI